MLFICLQSYKDLAIAVHSIAAIKGPINNSPSFVSLQKFVQGLSILSRGTLEEKLCWTFSLYDINGDGQITREEMSDIVTSIYELSNPSEVTIDGDRIKEKVDRIFQVGEILHMFSTNWRYYCTRTKILNQSNSECHKYHQFSCFLENGPQSRRCGDNRRIPGVLSMRSGHHELDAGVWLDHMTSQRGSRHSRRALSLATGESATSLQPRQKPVGEIQRHQHHQQQHEFLHNHQEFL